jgi:hypothetical protein
MKRNAVRALKLSSAVLCGLCAVALIPAALGACVGWGWLDLPIPARLSAVALVAAPLPLAMACFFAWKAAAGNARWRLFASGACVLIVVALYVVVQAWGGRMLI